MSALIKLTLMAALGLLCVGSPLSQRGAEIRGVRQSLAPSERLEPEPQSRTARTERLPEDQREIVSKQILQALSEIIQRDDCISDYQGWVDFGRRNAD